MTEGANRVDGTGRGILSLSDRFDRSALPSGRDDRVETERDLLKPEALPGRPPLLFFISIGFVLKMAGVPEVRVWKLFNSGEGFH